MLHSKGAREGTSLAGQEHADTQDRSWVFTGAQVQKALFPVSSEDQELQLYPKVQVRQQEELGPEFLARSSLGPRQPCPPLGERRQCQ